MNSAGGGEISVFCVSEKPLCGKRCVLEHVYRLLRSDAEDSQGILRCTRLWGSRWVDYHDKEGPRSLRGGRKRGDCY